MSKAKKPAKVSKKKSLSFKDMLKSTGTRTMRAATAGRPIKGAVKLCNAESVGVTVKVARTDDLSSISLCLTNDTLTPANIETTGTVLHPSDASFQRLFVAGVEAEPVSIVTVQPRSTIEIDLSTCCMDKSKSCPANCVEYSITEKAPRPQDVQAAFAWLSARRSKAELPPLGRASEIKTDSFCLQREFRGDNKVLSPYPGEKDNLNYVQRVCWDSCGV